MYQAVANFLRRIFRRRRPLQMEQIERMLRSRNLHVQESAFALLPLAIRSDADAQQVLRVLNESPRSPYTFAERRALQKLLRDKRDEQNKSEA